MSLINQIRADIKTEHQGEILFSGDPMEEMLKRGLAAQTGNGLFVLKGELIKILDSIEEEILSIAKAVKAEPAYVPCLLSWENTQKSEYLKSFTNQAMVVDPLEVPGDHLGIVSPTVCYHVFSSLASKKIDRNQVITAFSKCSRKEEGALNNLSRLTNFSMREIIFLGTEEFCQNKRQEILAYALRMMDEVFGLSYKVVTASDPFFGENSEVKKIAQIMSESKYEIQTLLPYDNSTVSTSSYNYHGKVFYGRFNIQPGRPEFNYSGCVGWGYERILYAILAQKGFDFTSPYYKKLFLK